MIRAKSWADERCASAPAEAAPEHTLSSWAGSGESWDKTRNMVDWFGVADGLPAMTVTYLEILNREQRRAVEHGVQTKNGAPGAALLVIAGAGSGKTNTVAHRVAHLIVNGADPRRILLMTFSRRAAVEMTRRVERIARQAMGSSAGVMTDALTWAGTFHGIAARLLREYADQIGR
jgi:DNA helicase-2/ATP-dependent DNA helicase PcrA